MVKNFKKLTLVTLLTAATLTTVACSSPAATNNNQTQDTNTKLSNVDVLRKTIDNHKNLTSFTSTEVLKDDDILLTNTAIYNKEPFLIKEIIGDSDGILVFEEYIDSSFIYESSDYSPKEKPQKLEWKKETNTRAFAQYLEDVFFFDNLHYAVSSFENNSPEATLTENDTTYELVIDIQDTTEIRKTTPDFEYKKYNFKAIIDKKTLLIQSIEENATNSDDTPHFVKIEFSTYNSAPAITLPEDAKSAVEA